MEKQEDAAKQIRKIIEDTGICHVNMRDMLHILLDNGERLKNDKDLMDRMFSFSNEYGLDWLSVITKSGHIETMRFWKKKPINYIEYKENDMS